MKVIIAGGGTGGHLMPGIAVARELERRHPRIRILFVGAERGIEKRVVPEEGFELATLNVGGFKRTGWRRRLQNLAALAGALFGAARIVREFRPDAVVGLGGYASFPVMGAATLLGVPRLVMEQNVFPGLANRLVGRFASVVAVPDERAGAHFGRRAVVTGNPVRPAFKEIGARPNGARIELLVTGGSQGARSINRAVIEALPYLETMAGRLRFVHQTGERDESGVREAYRKAGFEAQVSAFFSDFAAQYRKADLLVCRAGATTVAEVRAAGRAGIFIPLEYAADDHQRKNARAMVEKRAGVMIDPLELTGERLAQEISRLVDDPAALDAMGDNARALAVLDSEARIADLIERIMKP